MKKIAITGASGFIGTFVTKQFALEKGVTIVPLTRDCGSEFYTDYSLEDLKKWFIDVDIVVHLAAKRGGDGKFSEYQQNIFLAEKVSQACKENNVDKLIFISSISVYSDQTKLPWNEEQKNEPKNYYGLSKLISEDICRLNLEQAVTKLVILRLAHVYGPNEKNNYMINLFMRKAFNKKSIHVKNVSENRREFIYVKDVADAIITVCKKNISDKKMILNVGTNDVLTNQEVAKIITDVFNGGKLRVESLSQEILQNHSYMEHNRIERIYHYKPKYNMFEAMSDIFEIMRRDGKSVPIMY